MHGACGQESGHGVLLKGLWNQVGAHQCPPNPPMIFNFDLGAYYPIEVGIHSPSAQTTLQARHNNTTPCVTSNNGQALDAQWASKHKWTGEQTNPTAQHRRSHALGETNPYSKYALGYLATKTPETKKIPF